LFIKKPLKKKIYIFSNKKKNLKFKSNKKKKNNFISSKKIKYLMNYQLALLKPGILPLLASNLKTKREYLVNL